MKRFTLLFCGLLMAAAFLFSSCKKEIVPTVNKFFFVDNATLVAKELPKTSFYESIQVSANEKVLPGGSSFVRVSSPMDASKIIIGMKDQKGYYEAAPNAKDIDNYSFVLVVDPNIVLGKNETGFTILVALADANGSVSQFAEQFVELYPVVKGNLQVSLSFDQDMDLDLHLVEPEQTGYSFQDRHISYVHQASPNGGKLVLNSNLGCIIDGINNECVVYDDNAHVVPGQYTVYVDMFTNCSTSTEPTNWVVSVFYKGELIASQSGGNPAIGSFASNAPSNYGNLNNLKPAMTFVIPN